MTDVAKTNSYTPEEEALFIELLDRLKLPVSYPLFQALMRNTISCPVELACFNSKHEVLLVHRSDEEFQGYHSPGTVLRYGESVQDALDRLVRTEYKDVDISPLTELGWHQNRKGKNPGWNPVRDEISICNACLFVGNEYKGEGEFFPLDQLPSDMVEHHKVLVPEIARRFFANQK